MENTQINIFKQKYYEHLKEKNTISYILNNFNTISNDERETIYVDLYNFSIEYIICSSEEVANQIIMEYGIEKDLAKMLVEFNNNLFTNEELKECFPDEQYHSFYRIELAHAILIKSIDFN
jgi:hypothetical protein